VSAPILVKVIFRAFKDGGDVIALFPEVPFDRHLCNCQSYQHVGQHGGANYSGVMRNTRAATRKEYAELAEELHRIGYALVVKQGDPGRAMEKKRRAELKIISCTGG